MIPAVHVSMKLLLLALLSIFSLTLLGGCGTFDDESVEDDKLPWTQQKHWEGGGGLGTGFGGANPSPY